MSTFRLMWTMRLFVLLAGLVSTPAQAQFDLAGEWLAIVHEDGEHRGSGPRLGDYTGLPINDAARQKAEAWDASILSQPEQQANPHPAQYSFRGPGPDLRIEKILDPATDELIGYRTNGTFGRADRTIWLDGRGHPLPNALHTWGGFSTGVWVDNMLVVTTTHMKMGVIQRNGTPSSPYAVMTERFFRHGTYLTMVSIIDDPIYLEEPFVRSQTWTWYPPQNVERSAAFEIVEEVDMPPGWVPHWPLGTKQTQFADEAGIPFEATQGGAETLYPEYRIKLREMIAEGAVDNPTPATGN